MDRNARALTLALLCVLAVALAAATLANPQHPPGAGDGAGGPGFDESGPPDQGDGDSDSGDGLPEPDDGVGAIQVGPACVPFLLSPAFGALALGAYLAVGAYFYRRDNLAMAVVVLFLLTMVALPGWLLFTGCGSDAPTNQDGGVVPELPSGEPSERPAAGGSDGTHPLFAPTTVLAGLAAVAVLLAAVAYRATGDDEPPEDPPIAAEADADDEAALGALATAAGEAADRIAEAEDLENEVYRAWRDMTGHLDVPHPESSTPAEFAAAARDVGMDDDSVAELTDLFREVRYGGASPTEDREQRAVDALRAIEARYGGAE
ncbi:DUF4129 domain-containing protein [Halobacterium yunchengense]|uniref:DUF4129 domain-containing protein n=1 Tax=Halobacterium yunchengense TaxID=3108497 RepID=UPI003008B2A7